MRNPFAVAVARMQGVEQKSYTTGQMIPAHMDRQPQWSEWDTDKAIRDGFKLSAIVYACIQKLMQSAASLPWLAYERQGDEWEPAPEHPLTHLLEHPNAHMGRQQMMERLTSHMFLGGNGLLTKIRVRNIPVELWPADITKVKPVPSRTDFMLRYDFDRDGTQIPLEPRDVIHTMFTDPATPFWGMSPLQAAARTVDTDIEAVRWNKVSMQNRAIPDGVFTYANPIDRAQYEEARAWIDEQYAGPDNARKAMVLGYGATWQSMAFTPAEMDFLASRGMNREEIAAVFGVPLPLVIAQKENTYANYETARKAYWGDTVVPYMDGIRDAFNRSLVPDFGNPRDLAVDYDTSDVEALREDYAATIKTAREMQQLGIPLNAIIQKLELDIDPVEGGDVSLVPSTMIPITMAGEGSPQAPPPDVL